MAGFFLYKIGDILGAHALDSEFMAKSNDR